MKSSLRILLLPALLALAACPNRQAPAPEPGAGHFLKAQAYAAIKLPPPPPSASKAELEEFLVLQEWQARRTPEQCAAAGAQGRAFLEEFPVFASAFPNPLPPDVKTFFDEVRDDTELAVTGQKDRFKRERPFVYRKDLEPCIGRIGGLSYPSGHAAIARVYALVLSDMMPGRRAEFMAAADQAALYRVISGVHYPSDIEAGKFLGETVYDDLKASPAFSKAFAGLWAYSR